MRRRGLVRVELWLTEIVVARLDDMAERQADEGKTRTSLIRSAISACLDQWESEQGMRERARRSRSEERNGPVAAAAAPVVVVAEPPAAREPVICHRCRDGKHGDCQKGKMSNPEIAARERCECADPGHEEFAARFRADIARIKGVS